MLNRLIQSGHLPFGFALSVATFVFYAGQHVAAGLTIASAATLWWALANEP